MSQPIHQEVTLPATPDRVYAAYVDSKQHSAFTEAPADIKAEPGGTFSTHGGMISGRNIELVPGKRIVQAWRVGNWPEGVYSIVRIELAPSGSGTKVTLDHDGFPEGEGEHLGPGWYKHYWDRLPTFLS